MSAAEPTFDTLYAQILALGEGVTGEILVPGVVSTMSRPAAAHRYAARVLAGELGRRFDPLGSKGWWIEVEAEVRLPRDRLAVPDLAGWRVDSVPAFALLNPIQVIPNWCCEVLSPSTGGVDRLVKLPMYLASGVEHVWLVDPAQRSIEVYASRDGLPLLVSWARDAEVATLPPFDFSIELETLWLTERLIRPSDPSARAATRWRAP